MRIATIRSGSRVSYLFGAEGSGPLIAVDPGTEIDALLAQARGRRIERIILTSGFGYIPSVRAMQRATGAEIAAHRLLCLHLASARLQDLVPLSGGASFALEDTVPYRILATPGVDPFGVSILLAKAYLFTGETLAKRRPGRLDGPGADPRSLFVSMRVLAGLPDGTQVLSGRDFGEGNRSTIGRERRENPAFQLDTPDALSAWTPPEAQPTTPADEPADEPEGEPADDGGQSQEIADESAG